LRGKYDVALKCFLETLRIRRLLITGGANPIAEVLTHLGRTYQAMDDHTAAISCFQQALDIKQNDVTMYETRRLLGSSYLECDNYDDAVRTLEACLHFQETVKGNESEEWVSIAYDLATAKINSSTNIDEALSLLEQCIVLSKQSGTADGRLANALFQYGQIINNSPDKADEALGHFEECLHIRRGFGNVMEISDVLFEIGAIHESKKQYRATLESYQESLALRQSIDAQDERTADLLYRTGEVQRLSGKLDKAFNNITIALGAYYMSVGKNHRKVADTFHSLGYICGESFINYFPAIMNSIQ
jgi:tetratricopeptide (TPR) repeat protein